MPLRDNTGKTGTGGSTVDVAIIGAGFAGTTLAIHLKQFLPAGKRIALIGGDSIARGVAYGTKEAAHLLNVRTGRLSLFPDDDSHFVRWCAERTGAAQSAPARLAEAYVPRAVYGDYLADGLEGAMANPPDSPRLDIIEATAMSLRRHEGGFEIGLADGSRLAAKAVALCLGHQRPEFPLSADSVDEDARGRMIADPWNDPRMKAIERDANVLLVGTGLTMVDQALSLKNAGHRGRLTAISRHGALPEAHRPMRAHPIEVDLRAGQASLANVFRSAVSAARAADAAGKDWRGVVDGIREHAQDIWHALDHTDRRRFLRHCASFWSVHRHRMAPAVAAEVTGMVRSGALQVRAGRLTTVWHRLGRVMAVLKGRGSPVRRIESFDWIINCSGLGRVRPSAMQPVLADAFAHGLLRPDSIGLGLDVTLDSILIGRHGAATAGLFAVGPLTAGRFFEITAVPEIRVQCAEVAARITERIAVDRRVPTSESISAERRRA